MMSGLFGLVCLALAFLAVAVITPAKDESMKGLRRARKLELATVPAGADAAGSFWHSLAIAVLGSACWFYFAVSLFGSPWCPQLNLPQWSIAILPLSFILLVVCFQTVLECLGKKAVFMSMLFVWIVPCLVAVLLRAASPELAIPATYLTAVSGLSMPFYGVISIVGEKEFALPNLVHLRVAFIGALLAYGVVASLLISALRREHRRREEICKRV